MAKMLLILACALFAAAPVMAAGQLEYTLLSDFPSPGPSPQGLAWDGEALWCVDDSTDTVYRLDPDTGDVLHSFPSPDSTPKGITWDGSHLWIAESDAEKLFQVDAGTGEIMKSLDAHYSTREDTHWPLMSLGWDGEMLWCNYSAGYSSKIAMVDPETGDFERTEFFEQYDGMAWRHDGLWGVKMNGIFTSRVEYRDFINDTYKTEVPQYFATGLAANESLSLIHI